MNTDQSDDLITLTGLNRISTWRFPINLKECPLRTCRIRFKSRSLAIAHYKSNHASTSVLCFLCKKPISSKCGATNYIKHFKRLHPHVKISLSQLTKIESSAQSIQKIAQPSKHFMTVPHSSAAQSNFSKKRCKVCGKKCISLSRHMMEVHTKKRILCPLISCDFTSKRLANIRKHWRKVHYNFQFPEISQNSGFTYRTTTDETQQCVSTFEFFVILNRSSLRLKFLNFLLKSK